MNEVSSYKRPVAPKGLIVVDLGCASYPIAGGMEDSVVTLIDRFKPSVYFGFDPLPGMQDGVGEMFETTVLISRKAAWTTNGTQPFGVRGNCSHVGGEDTDVPCFDLAAFLKTLPKTETVLKLDVEGAEYVLLPHLIEQEALGNVYRILVEWHVGERANGQNTRLRKKILRDLTCEVEEWQ